MAGQVESTAIVFLSSNPKLAVGQEFQLKRLALLFDRIEYMLPEIWGISEETYLELESSAELPQGTTDDNQNRSVGFDPLKHPKGALLVPLSHLPEPIVNTVQVLESHGIAKPSSAFDSGADRSNSFYARVKHDLAWEESRDPVFEHVSGTKPSDFDFSLTPRVLEVYGDYDPTNPTTEGLEVTQRMVIHFFDPPASLLDSSILSDVLYDASVNDTSPVFLHPKHRLELRRRYELYQDGLEALNKFGFEDLRGASFGASFGEVSYAIANGIIDTGLISIKSTEEIIEYRNANEEGRRRLISEHLVGATNLVADNPWDHETKAELQKYIAGDLSAAILKYQEQTQETWQKLWGTTFVTVAQVGRDALIAGAIGTAAHPVGIVAEVIPNTTGWGLMLGAVVSAARNAPEFVREIHEAMSEIRKRNHSGIAYLARFG